MLIKSNMVEASRKEHVMKKIILSFLNQNICCGYSKEPSQGDGSFEQPKHMFELIGKQIITILH